MNFDQRRAQMRLVTAGYGIGGVDGDFAGKSFAALMAYIARLPVGGMHLELGKAAAKWFPQFDITSAEAISCNLGQSSVETGGFTKLVENLNYSAQGLANTWSGRYAVDPKAKVKVPNALALSLAHKPEAIANKTYGGRFGNAQPGDGFKYRGRGTKQTTFHDNYAEVERVTGLPVLAQPDMLADPDLGMRAGCIYWQEKGCGPLADIGDLLGLTKRINGGVNGLAERTEATRRARAILG